MKYYFPDKIILIVSSIIVIFAFLISGWWGERIQNTPQKTIVGGWEFPKEEGEHSNLGAEIWYFAGHLEEENKPENKFGVTFLISKNGIIAVNLINGATQENFPWVATVDHYDAVPREKLTIKSGDNFWLETETFEYKIRFKFDDKEIDLDLASIKKPYLRYTTLDSFYYQQTKVWTSGTLSFSGKEYKINGWGWIEHQGFKNSWPFSNWEWYAVQLDNDIEMSLGNYFDIQLNEFQRAAVLFEDNQMEEIKNENLSIEHLEFWTDNETGYKYPVKTRLKIPSKNTDLEFTAIVKDQVIAGLGKAYEGSFCVEGVFEGEQVSGRAQLECLAPCSIDPGDNS